MHSILMKSIKCTIILFLCIKMNFTLFIFESYRVLIYMMKDVFINLRKFFAFFMILIAIFSCFIQILLPESKYNYEGAGYFSYLIMAFRTSIGDFTFNEYKAKDMQTVTWLVWFMLMIFGNIVSMNFIIAVVSDSYNKSIAKSA